MELLEIKEKLSKAKASKDTLETLLVQRKERLEQLKLETETVLKSQSLLQEVAREVQSQLSLKIDNVVNLGLATCFPGYTFSTTYVSSRGKTEVQFVVKNGESIVEPMEQCGGGLVDVLCFCLRIAVYSISGTCNVIVFDEPFRYVSKSLRGKVAELLSVLCEKLDVQLVQVTHIEELSEGADKRILVVKTNGTSEVSYGN